MSVQRGVRTRRKREGGKAIWDHGPRKPKGRGAGGGDKSKTKKKRTAQSKLSSKVKMELGEGSIDLLRC